MKKLKSFLRKNYFLYYNVLGDDYLYAPINKKHKKFTKSNECIDLTELKLLDERVRNSILIRYIEEKSVEISASRLERLIESDFTKEINPFEVYIKNLEPFNGDSELNKLFKAVKTKDTDYFEWALKKWLVAFVASALEDGISNHQMIVLMGKQGIGKSTWCERLLPPVLRDYYYGGEFNPFNKDHLAYLSDRLIINVDEMSGYNKRTFGAFKDIVTKPGYSIRRPYGRRNNNFIRRASFMGSTNDKQILLDLTGNRRFLCFEVESIDYDYNINYDLLYSELYDLYKSGFKYWFDNKGDDIKRIEDHNENYLQKSLEEEIILNNVVNYRKYDKNLLEQIEFKWLTATELIEKLHPYTPKGYKLNNSMLGKILTKEDFEFKKSNGTRKYHLYIRPQAESLN